MKTDMPCGFDSRRVHWGMRRAVRGGCIGGYTGERHTCSASGSTMGCSRPLIFSFSSHKEEKEKLPPQKKGGAREVRIPSLRPATSTFPLPTRSRGTNFWVREFHSWQQPLRAAPSRTARVPSRPYLNGEIGAFSFLC